MNRIRFPIPPAKIATKNRVAAMSENSSS